MHLMVVREPSGSPFKLAGPSICRMSTLSLLLVLSMGSWPPTIGLSAMGFSLYYLPNSAFHHVSIIHPLMRLVTFKSTLTTPVCCQGSTSNNSPCIILQVKLSPLRVSVLHFRLNLYLIPFPSSSFSFKSKVMKIMEALFPPSRANIETVSLATHA